MYKYILLIILISGCQTTKIDPQSRDNLVFLNGNLFSNTQLLVLEGDNDLGYLGESGLWYLSGSRLNHKLRQIYFYSFSTKASKRITHQDGDIFSPNETQKPNWIYYASTTDELKERPDLSRIVDKHIVRNDKPIQTHLDLFPNTEIYRSQTNGFKIDRITSHPGFDGTPQVSTARNKLYYNSIDDDQTRIYELSLRYRRNKKVLISYKKEFQILFRFSNDFKKAVWKHWNAKENKFQFVFGNKWGHVEHIIVDNLDSLQGMFWNKNNDGVFFSSNHLEGKHKLFYFGTKGKCLTQISDTKYELSKPVLSPDNNQIAFLHHTENGNGIYISNLKTFPTCPNQ